jgi:Xaa-Pro aminopeptidase
MLTIPERLAALRHEMQQQGFAACLILSADPHQSEYLPEHWQARQWLSGFTGSAGTLIVTPTFAGLWTDARYFLQAEQQLQGTGIQLQKLSVPHTPEYVDWLQQQLAEGDVLSVDGASLSLSLARLLRKKLAAKNIQMDTRFDLVDTIWHDRPPRPATPIFSFPDQFAGQSRRDKLAQLRQQLHLHQADYLLVNALDDIAWTLNIRASDVACNPFCVSFLVVGKQESHWWVGEERLGNALRAQLAADGVAPGDYDQLGSWLAGLPEDVQVLVDPATISTRLYETLGRSRSIELSSPVAAMKAIKNRTELSHLRQAMRKDGCALLRLYRWLEGRMPADPPTEAEIALQLDAFRREQGDYFGSSFDAIVGYAANGAIIHYKPEEASCARLRPEGLLLLDSGGQYLQGTTDITRTTALGEPTLPQKMHYTLVLKGHIALATAFFPLGTGGAQLDTLARQPLWAHGLNYGHGTGHGVGFFLGVHEGPQRIAANAAAAGCQQPLLPGMLTSNEPGLYIEGAYGIRLENLILCVERVKNAFGQFLSFDTLTLFPFDQKLIDLSLLSTAEIQWLDDYHQRVQEELSPMLTEAEQQWLAGQCRPLM